MSLLAYFKPNSNKRKRSDEDSDQIASDLVQDRLSESEPDGRLEVDSLDLDPSDDDHRSLSLDLEAGELREESSSRDADRQPKKKVKLQGGKVRYVHARWLIDHP